MEDAEVQWMKGKGGGAGKKEARGGGGGKKMEKGEE
jgi:hypothetical protein